MILPSQSIEPSDSLIYLSTFVIELLADQELSADELHEKIRRIYPKPIEIEMILICLTYLFVIGVVEKGCHETVKIKR